MSRNRIFQLRSAWPWQALVCCAAGLLAGPPARAAVVPGVLPGPVHAQADVVEFTNPGATLFSDTASATGIFFTPKKTAELLKFLPPGGNASDRGPGNNTAFASALAETDGNGGVGIANVILGLPPGNSQPTTEGLVSTATWTQTLNNIGSEVVSVSLHLAIPAVDIGLFGVPPFRTAITNTEEAEATASVVVVTKHLDGSTSSALVFDYGLVMQETQVPLGPGQFANTAVATLLGAAAGQAVQSGENASGSKTVGLPAFDTDLALGSLLPGESLQYNYVLQVSGSTKGFERGYHAFIGDPFGVNLVSGNLATTVTVVNASVAEPAGWALLLLGLAPLLLRRLRPSRRALRPCFNPAA